jgi:hypothetical protein
MSFTVYSHHQMIIGGPTKDKTGGTYGKNTYNTIIYIHIHTYTGKSQENSPVK